MAQSVDSAPTISHMPFFNPRSWPTFPVRVSRIIWLLFALLLACSGVQATFYVISGGVINLPIAVALIAASIGIFLCQSWAYRVALAYPLITIGAVAAHPLVSGRDLSSWFARWLVRLFESLPLGLAAEEVARYFSWWGVPGVASATLFLLAVFALLYSSKRQPLLPRDEAADGEAPSHDQERKRSKLKGITRMCGLVIVAPIVCVLLVAIGDPPGASPGGFGGGYLTLFAAVIATPFVLAGAIGLVIAFVLRARLK